MVMVKLNMMMTAKITEECGKTASNLVMDGIDSQIKKILKSKARVLLLPTLESGETIR